MKATSFIVGLVFFGLIISIFYNLFFQAVPRLVEGSDFLHYLAPAQMVRERAGSDLYNVEANYNAQKKLVGEGNGVSILVFRNLPFLTVIFLPFTFLPLFTAFKFFLLFNVILLFFFGFFYRKYITKSKIPRIYIFTLIFTFLPVFETFKNGQVSVLLLIFFSLILAFLLSERHFHAGLTASLLLVKIQFVIFLPLLWTLSRSKRRFLQGIIFGTVLVVAASILVAGPGFLLHYSNYLMETEGPAFGSRFEEMFTFYALLRYAGIPESLSFIINGTLYVTFLFYFSKIYRKTELYLSFIIAILITLFFSVHVLLHDLILLLLPLLYLLDKSLYSKTEFRSVSKNLLVSLVLFIFPFFSIAYPAVFFSPFLIGGAVYFILLSKNKLI